MSIGMDYVSRKWMDLPSDDSGRTSWPESSARQVSVALISLKDFAK
jgi:hypothetical protein